MIRFLQSLPKNYLGEALGRQLLKSGTSIGANYREANRAESKADFIHKLAIVEKEASETLYWLELMLEGGIGANQEAMRLMQEAKELLPYSPPREEHRKKIDDSRFHFRNSNFQIRNQSAHPYHDLGLPVSGVRSERRSRIRRVEVGFNL